MVRGEDGNSYVYPPTKETVEITGNEGKREEMSTLEIKKILLKLKKLHVTKLNIGGGEPLLRKDTPEIIDFAKKLGFRIYISTNGSYTKDRWPEFKDNIDVMGLSLDGSSNEFNMTMGRKNNAYNKIVELLEFLKNQKYTHELKLGTVVSKVNAEDVLNIGKLLFQNENIKSPDVWRLYQFEAIGEGSVNQNKYRIDDNEYETLVEKIRQTFPEANISSRSNADHNNSFFFISPDGMLQTVDTIHRSVLDLKNAQTDDIYNTLIENITTITRSQENRDWAFDNK